MITKGIKSITAMLLVVMLMVSVLTVTAYAGGDDDDEVNLDEILIPIPIVVTHEHEHNSRGLTPPGNLSLVDDAVVASIEDKQFMTVTTKNGNVFYIVVDRDGNTENVYFLNLVDELDLIALLEDDFEMPVAPTPEPFVPPVAAPVEPEPVKEPEKSTNRGLITLIVFLALGGIGAGVYFKIIKPKHAQNNSNTFMTEDEFLNDVYEPEFETENSGDDDVDDSGGNMGDDPDGDEASVYDDDKQHVVENDDEPEDEDTEYI